NVAGPVDNPDTEVDVAIDGELRVGHAAPGQGTAVAPDEWIGDGEVLGACQDAAVDERQSPEARRAVEAHHCAGDLRGGRVISPVHGGGAAVELHAPVAGIDR